MSTREQEILERLRQAAAEDDPGKTQRRADIVRRLREAEMLALGQQAQMSMMGRFSDVMRDRPTGNAPLHGFRKPTLSAGESVLADLLPEGGWISRTPERPVRFDPAPDRSYTPQQREEDERRRRQAQMSVDPLMSPDSPNVPSRRPEARELDPLTGATYSALRTPGMFIEGAGGTLQAAGALMSAPKLLHPVTGERQAMFPPGEWLEKVGRVIGDMGRGQQEMFPASPSATQPGALWKSPKFIIERLPETVLQLGAQIALGGVVAKGATALTRTAKGYRAARFAGFATPVATLETGLTYRNALERHTANGMDHEEASLLAATEALVTGGMNTALEYAPFVYFMERLAPGAGQIFHKTMTSRWQAALGGAAVEGTEEALQEAWASTSAWLVGQDPEAFEALAERMAGGAVLGGLAGGMAAGARFQPGQETTGTWLDLPVTRDMGEGQVPEGAREAFKQAIIQQAYDRYGQAVLGPDAPLTEAQVEGVAVEGSIPAPEDAAEPEQPAAEPDVLAQMVGGARRMETIEQQLDQILRSMGLQTSEEKQAEAVRVASDMAMADVERVGRILEGAEELEEGTTASGLLEGVEERITAKMGEGVSITPEARQALDDMRERARRAEEVAEARAQLETVEKALGAGLDEGQQARMEQLRDQLREQLGEDAPAPAPEPEPELPSPAEPSLTRKTFEGRAGDRSHLTAKEEGTAPTDVVARLAGARGEVRGEHRNRQGARWDEFKADIAERGIQDPIFITVDPGGEPVIAEGNHRIDAAVELGLELVPVEVRYFGKAEQDGFLLDRATRQEPEAAPEETDRARRLIPRLLEHFDEQLQRSKKPGADGIVVLSPKRTRQAREILGDEHALAGALDDAIDKSDDAFVTLRAGPVGQILTDLRAIMAPEPAATEERIDEDTPDQPKRPVVILGHTRGSKTLAKLQEQGWGRMEIASELKPSSDPADEGFAYRTDRKLSRHYDNEPWAMDTGAFVEARAEGSLLTRQGIEEQQDDLIFGPWLSRAEEVAELPEDERPFMVVLPDVPDLKGEGLGDVSLAVSKKWLAQAPDGLPYYLPVQNGMTPEQVGAWLDVVAGGSNVAGIFLGGDDRFKAETAQAWVDFAHARGLKLHYGRAGTLGKLRHAMEVGADSVDSAFPLWTDERLEEFIQFWKGEHPQTELVISEDAPAPEPEPLNILSLREWHEAFRAVREEQRRRTDDPSGVTSDIPAALELQRDRLAVALDLNPQWIEGASAEELQAFFAEDGPVTPSSLNRESRELLAATLERKLASDYWPNRRMPMPDPAWEGARDYSYFPGNGENVRFRWRLVRLSDLYASHDAETFEPLSEHLFPSLIQGRDYKEDKQAQQEVIVQAAALDPARALDASIDVTVGPATVSHAGLAVGGNQRIMMLKRARALHPDKFAAYQKYLAENLHRYGLSDVVIEDDMVLVRELIDTAYDYEDVEVLRALNKASDEVATKAKDETSEADSMAKQFIHNDKALQHYIDTAGEDQSIREYLETVDGQKFMGLLVESGVISQASRAQLMDENGEASDRGRKVVESMFLLAAIRDAAVVRRMPNSLKRKIATSLPGLTRASRVGGEWEMGEVFGQASDIIIAAREAKTTVRSHIDQEGMFGNFDPAASQLAVFLSENKSGELRKAFTRYGTMAEEAVAQRETTDMFGRPPVTADEARKMVFDMPPLARRRPVRPPTPSPEPGPAPTGAAPQTKRQRYSKPLTEDFGNKNKLVTNERNKQIDDELGDMLNQLNTVNPKMLMLGVEKVVYYVEGGVRGFAEVMRLIADDLGVELAKLRPFMRSWYNGARDYMEDQGADIAGMDDANAVREALKQIDAEIAGETTDEDVERGDERVAGGNAGVGGPPVPGREGAGRAGGGAGAGTQQLGPRPGTGAGRDADADVVADERPDAEPEVPPVPVLSRRRVEAGAADTPARRRDLEAANDSPVFVPLAPGLAERRAPHPRVVVETRSAAGIQAPEVTAAIESDVLDAAWGDANVARTLSDEQVEQVLRTKQAWQNGHGYLVAADVGVGKTRMFAGAMLEAIEMGARRLVYVTKGEQNLNDALAEFHAVAGGKFPARIVNLRNTRIKKKANGEWDVPMPREGEAVLYVMTTLSRQRISEEWFPALREAVKPDAFFADEAHLYKNVNSGSGLAWTALHQQLIRDDAKIMYGTATPGVHLQDLNYLYGLKEWAVGGFEEWVSWKTGSGPKPVIEDYAGDMEVSKMGNTLKIDALETSISPAETEQIMREMKGRGKYMALDIWRGGVTFDVETVDIMGDDENVATYNEAARFARDVQAVIRRYLGNDARKKRTGGERSMLQSYMKQLMFQLRLPRVLELAQAGLDAGEQVVISISSVSGDEKTDESVAASSRLQAAINAIQYERWVPEAKAPAGMGLPTWTSPGGKVYVNTGIDLDALRERNEMIERANQLATIDDPIEAIQSALGGPDAVGFVTGQVSTPNRLKYVGEFQRGDRKVIVISKAGKEGISLHDVNGARRRMIVSDYEWSADTFKQELGRVDRSGQLSAPAIVLAASNLAGERKFAATIQARMTALGAVSKGSAESTGTDALDEFDMSGRIVPAAMRDVLLNISTEDASYLTSKRLVDPSTGRVRKSSLGNVRAQALLLDLQFMPLEASEDLMERWLRRIEELTTGEAEQASQQRRTARASGDILRVTELQGGESPLELFEVRNENGEDRAILVGFVTENMDRIQGARGHSVGARRRSYSQFTERASGEMVAGLNIRAGEARRLKAAYGIVDPRFLTPEDVRSLLRSGDRVAVQGEKGAVWYLKPTRRGDFIGVDGMPRDDIRKSALTFMKEVGYWGNHPSPGRWYFGEQYLTEFLDRFPALKNTPNPANETQQSVLDEMMGGEKGFPQSGVGFPSTLHAPAKPYVASPKARERQVEGGALSNQQVIDRVGDFIGAFGRTVPIFYGHIGSRKALGFFVIREEVIRIKSSGRVSTAIHEAGHAIEKIVYGHRRGGVWNKKWAGVDKAIQDELVGLGKALYGSRKPNGGYKSEGFAEFMRLYITDPATAKRLAPRFYDWFEDMVLSREGTMEAAKRMRAAYNAWSKPGSLERARAQMHDPAAYIGFRGLFRGGPQKQVRGWWTMENLVDQAQPIIDLAEEVYQRHGVRLDPEQDPGQILQFRRLSHDRVAQYFVETAALDFYGNRVGLSLTDALRGISGRRRIDFGLYLYALRSYALLTDPKGARQTGMDLEDAVQILKELDSPEFRVSGGFVDANGRVQEGLIHAWQEHLLDYVAASSPTFAEVVRNIRKRDPGAYIPLQRWFGEVNESMGSAVPRSRLRRSFVKRLRGSDLPIKDPFHSIVRQAGAFIRAAHERQVFDAIFNLTRFEGMGNVMSRVTRDRVPVLRRTAEELVEQMERTLRGMGIELTLEVEEGREVDLASEVITFFAPKTHPDSKEPIYPIYHNGRIEWYQLDKELFKALSAMDPYALPDFGRAQIMMRALEASASTFRLGTTGMRATFGLITNLLRDGQTLFVNTRAVGAEPLVMLHWLKTTFAVLGGAPLRGAAQAAGGTGELFGPNMLDVYRRLGVEMAQILSHDINHVDTAVRRAFDRTIIAKALDGRSHIELYREFIQLPEGVPRIVEMERVAKEIGWDVTKPLDMRTAILLGNAGKQVTTDFTAAGETVRIFNRIFPFLNAQIQGPRANVRAWNRNPQAVAAKLISMFLAGLALWWWNKDELWWRDMTLAEKLLYWHVPFSRTDGRKELLRLPGSFEVHIVSQLPVMMMDSWYARDPEAARQFMLIAMAQVSPVSSMMMGQPIFEELRDQWRNRDAYWGTPIVPRRLEAYVPHQQYDEYTTRAAILIGKTFAHMPGAPDNWQSPKRIDHFVRGIFGPAAGDLMGFVSGYGPEGRPAEINTDDLASLNIAGVEVGVLFQRGGREGGRSRAVNDLYDLAEKFNRIDRDWGLTPEGRPDVPEEVRNTRLVLDDAIRATVMLYQMRALAETQAEKDALSREARRIALDVTKKVKAGEIVMPDVERYDELRYETEVRAGEREAGLRRRRPLARR